MRSTRRELHALERTHLPPSYFNATDRDDIERATVQEEAIEQLRAQVDDAEQSAHALWDAALVAPADEGRPSGEDSELLGEIATLE